MQEIKKQLELLLISYFRDCYPAFPKGRMLLSESPDFIVRAKHSKKIGIELVRLFPEAPSHSTEESKSEKLRFELIEITKELFERSSSSKCFVKILFSEKKKIGEERILALAAQLANLLRVKLSNKNERSFFVYHFSSKELPEGIDEVLVIHHPKISESLWEEVNNSGISEDIEADLHRLIQKKEEKMYLYRKQQLDEYWLLITSDLLRNTRISNISNFILNEKESAFQRILFFDLMKSKVIELKMPSSG